MADFIELDRRFRELTKDELADAEWLNRLDGYYALRDMPWFAESARRAEREGLLESPFAPLDWSGLLERRRVVLLAGAGSGKTAEMRARARGLAGAGKFAFFAPLEQLAKDPLRLCLDPRASGGEAFERWEADGAAPAWFFLDSVDELKLTGETLQRALSRLRNEIGGNLHRARVVVSSRPSDWRPGLDMKTFEEQLLAREPPPAAPADAPPARTAEEAFLAPLRRDAAPAPPDDGAAGDSTELADPVTVVLRPLDRGRIERFAEARGETDPGGFLAEVQSRDAWVFARRPLDLADLLRFWSASEPRRLGTRQAQHKANIAGKLRDDPERRDKDALSPDDARKGAERLALALSLARGRTFRVPDREPDEGRDDGALDPAEVLSDWTLEQVQSLLRRALFDPATFGRVRFHHRSVEEYLAASYLRRLRDRGMGWNALSQLLFGERYGERIVFPSMRPVVAWLALWDDDVLREALAREPEILLDEGDPESLPVAERERLLRRYAGMYGKDGRRGVGVSWDQVRRLAHPDLASAIRELWDAGPENEEVRDLLVRTIREGRIVDCADIARGAALDGGLSPDVRATAIEAVAACGHAEYAREIVDAMLADLSTWPSETYSAAAEEFFPGTLSVDGLIALIERTGESDNLASRFEWILGQIVETIDPASDLAVELRNKLGELIRRGLGESPEIYDLHGQFDRFAPMLALLCHRQLSADNEASGADFYRSCAIASRFGLRQFDTHGEAENLMRYFAPGSPRRKEAFRAELALLEETKPELGARDRFHRVFLEESGLIFELVASDRQWLGTVLQNKGEPERRPVALHALLWLWRWTGRDESELSGLRAMLGGDAALQALLEEQAAPPDPEWARRNKEWKTKNRRRTAKRRKREESRLCNLKDWRNWLIADPADAFSPENSKNALESIRYWLRQRPQTSSTHTDVWDKHALAEAFGAEVADRAEAAFKAFWRSVTPLPWSTIAVENRNTTPYWQMSGLCGVYVEAATLGWSVALSPEEARAAALYATVEINGFPPFLDALTETHPDEVEAAIGSELIAQLRLSGEVDHLPIFPNLSTAHEDLKRLLAPRLLDALRDWPRVVGGGNIARWAENLERILRILHEVANGEARRTIAAECASRYRAAPDGPLALAWLRGLFRFDAEAGADVLAKTLADRNNPAVRARAVSALGNLFGHHDPVDARIEDPSRRVRALAALYRVACAHIRPEDDAKHEGAFEPDSRDHAEWARGALLRNLLDTPGEEACRVLRELSGEPDFSSVADMLRHSARKRAAEDAEPPPHTAEDIADLDKRLEAPPRGRDGLFETMMARLDDIARGIRHGDFGNRETLQRIPDETELQRNLAGLLEAKANGAYTVTRESEVADRKRTDIHLAATADGTKAVIEVKIADNWSLRELEEALESQLVGKYLRDPDRKAGCLLLTWHDNGKRKGWRRGRGGRAMDFAETVAHLNGKAREIERARSGDIRLAAFPLDLAPPAPKAQ